MKKIQFIKQGLLLLGSIAIATDLASLVHELSHGLGAILTGGTFRGITINPFSWSYCHSFSMNHLFHLSAGAIGAILICGLLFALLYRWARLWFLPLLLMGPIALIDTGAYYIVDILMRSGGDACRLIDEGVAPAVSIAAGIVCILLGFILAVLLIRKMKLLTFDFKGRLIVLGLGIIPHALAMLIWNCVYNRGEIGLWSVYAATTVILTVLFAALPPRLWRFSTDPSLNVTWKPAIIINCVYAGLLIFWFVGPFSAGANNNPFNVNIESFSERPDYFPEVLTPPPYATDVSFFHSSKSKVPLFLSYNFPESTPPEQIRKDVTDIHKSHGYILLTHSIDEPNEIQNSDWIEKTSTTDGVPFRTKGYFQCWLKMEPQPLYSYIAVFYMWKKEKFHTAYVIHNTWRYTEYEKLYNYATVHSELFDPNEIEQLRKLALSQIEDSDGPNQMNE